MSLPTEYHSGFEPKEISDMGVTLARGDIVQDTDEEESGYYGKQGEVTRVFPNGTVMVRFPVFMIPLGIFGYGEKVRPVSIAYKGNDSANLKKVEHYDQGVLTEHLVEKMFPNMWHSIRYHSTPFVDGIACEVEGCEEMAVGRSLINYVGTVCTLDLCAKHRKQWHGMCTESFPTLKSKPKE